MKVLIIGGVAGGANTATRLRRLDKEARILIFERGGCISYAACGLPYLIGEKIENPDSLILQEPSTMLRRYDIEVRIFSNVKEIDRVGKRVIVENLQNGETYSESYDKLVIATGAEPILPPIAGLASKRIFTLRTIPDALKIKAFISEAKAKSAVIAGGGATGMEMAENLKDLGLDVTVIELAAQLIAPLDPEMAEPVRSYLEERGVRVLLGNGAESVQEDREGLVINLRNGEIKTDMLIMGAGVRPDSSLAEKAGLTLGMRGAIVTDKHMRTSDPHIYAVGDAVQTYSFITGKPMTVQLAGPAGRQARVAAGNIAGQTCEYAGAQGTGIIKIFDMTVAFTGLSERDAERDGIKYGKIFFTHAPHAGYYMGGREMKIKIVFGEKDGKILGAQLVGFEGVDKRCDILAMAIRMGATAFDLTETDFAYSPPFGTPKDPVNVAGQIIGNMLKNG